MPQIVNKFIATAAGALAGITFGGGCADLDEADLSAAREPIPAKETVNPGAKNQHEGKLVQSNKQAKAAAAQLRSSLETPDPDVDEGIPTEAMAKSAFSELTRDIEEVALSSQFSHGINWRLVDYENEMPDPDSGEEFISYVTKELEGNEVKSPTEKALYIIGRYLASPVFLAEDPFTVEVGRREEVFRSEEAELREVLSGLKAGELPDKIREIVQERRLYGSLYNPRDFRTAADGIETIEEADKAFGDPGGI